MQEVYDSVANLLSTANDSLPIKEEAEWKGLDADDTIALHRIMEEINHNDFVNVARAAAQRLGL